MVILPGYKYEANSQSSLQVSSSNGNPLRLMMNPGHLDPGLFGGGDMVLGIILKELKIIIIHVHIYKVTKDW